jgi:iron complex transport system ATP-binding protein
VLLLDAGRLVADGSPADVFTEERLSRHYQASVEVVELDGRIAVVPRRAPAAQDGRN